MSAPRKEEPNPQYSATRVMSVKVLEPEKTTERKQQRTGASALNNKQFFPANRDMSKNQASIKSNGMFSSIHPPYLSNIFPHSGWGHHVVPYHPMHSQPPPPTHYFQHIRQQTQRGGSSFDSPTGSHTSNHICSVTLPSEQGSMTMVGGLYPTQPSPLRPFPPHGVGGAMGSTAHAHPHMPPPPNIGNYGNYLSPYGPDFHSAMQRPPQNPGMWAVTPPKPPQQIVVVESHEIQCEDVLCGRGGATNSHSGNKLFRKWVKEHQEQYLKAKKRDKPAVAAIIVDKVRERGGRFLKRYEHQFPNKQVLYVDIGDERAREKTCQALRENAPEIRKKRHFKAAKSKLSSPLSPYSTGSQSEDESDGQQQRSVILPKHDPEDADMQQQDERMEKSENTLRDRRDDISDRSTPVQSPKVERRMKTENDNEEDSRDHGRHFSRDGGFVKPLSLSSSSSSYSATTSTDLRSAPVLRPIAKLLPRKFQNAPPILVDELCPAFRNMYVQDFLPPCPNSWKDDYYGMMEEEGYPSNEVHPEGEYGIYEEKCRELLASVGGIAFV